METKNLIGICYNIKLERELLDMTVESHDKEPVL